MARLIQNFFNTTIDGLQESINNNLESITVENKNLRPSNLDTNGINVYDEIRWQKFDNTLKALWRNNFPSDVTTTFLQTTFLRLPANIGKFFPTTNRKQTSDSISVILSIALSDNNITINGTRYDLSYGDAIIFDPSETYEIESSTSDMLWNVNIVPKYKQDEYGNS